MPNMRFLQLKQNNKHDVEAFIECLFDWRDYGLTIPSLPHNIEIEWDQTIVKFDDGTYSCLNQAQYEAYMDFLTNKDSSRNANSIF